MFCSCSVGQEASGSWAAWLVGEGPALDPAARPRLGSPPGPHPGSPNVCSEVLSKWNSSRAPSGQQKGALVTGGGLGQALHRVLRAWETHCP